MLPRRVTLLLAAAATIFLWRRATRPDEHVDALYDDGSLIRLARGVEAEDLLDDARKLLTILG